MVWQSSYRGTTRVTPPTPHLPPHPAHLVCVRALPGRQWGVMMAAVRATTTSTATTHPSQEKVSGWEIPLTGADLHGGFPLQAWAEMLMGLTVCRSTSHNKEERRDT